MSIGSYTDTGISINPPLNLMQLLIQRQLHSNNVIVTSLTIMHDLDKQINHFGDFPMETREILLKHWQTDNTGAWLMQQINNHA